MGYSSSQIRHKNLYSYLGSGIHPVIDWIKAISPCHYTDEINSERITRLDPKTGETKWEIDARVDIQGTYSSKVHVKVYGPNLILIDGNPSKFMQGHNIFGTNDLLGLCSAFFLNVCKALNIHPTIEDIKLWKDGYPQTIILILGIGATHRIHLYQ